MNNKLIAITVGAALSIIVLASVLMPVIDDETSGLRTKTYEDNAGSKYFNSAKDFEMIYDISAGTYQIDGETITAPAYTNLVISNAFGVYSVAASDILIIDYNQKSEERHVSGTISVEVSGGAYTLTTPSTTYSGTVSACYYYAGADGDYVENIVFYANKGQSAMVRIGDGYWFADNAAIPITDITSGSATVMVQKYAGQTWSENVTATLTWDVEPNSDGTYSISNFLLDGTAPTPLLVLCPEEYATYSDNSYTSLVQVIPVFVIIGILLGVISLVAVKRTY